MIFTIIIIVVALIVLWFFAEMLPTELDPFEAFCCALFITVWVFGTALLVAYREGRG